MGGILKLGLSAAAVGIPSFFMGLVLPALAAAVTGSRLSLRGKGILLYATNILGGAIGLPVAAGSLIEKLGAFRTMLSAILINAAVGFVCLVVDNMLQKRIGLHSGSLDRPGPIPWVCCGMAFVSGMGIRWNQYRQELVR